MRRAMRPPETPLRAPASAFPARRGGALREGIGYIMGEQRVFALLLQAGRTTDGPAVGQPVTAGLERLVEPTGGATPSGLSREQAAAVAGKVLSAMRKQFGGHDEKAA